MDQLCLRVIAQEDQTFHVTCEVQSQGFSGRAESEFDNKSLDQFIGRLKSRDIRRDAPVVLAGGYWDPKDEGCLLDRHLYLACYPVDTVGGVGVKVELSTPPHIHERPESQCFVACELLTNCEVLADFASRLESVTLAGSGMVLLPPRPIFAFH